MNDNEEFMVIPESPIDEFSVPSQPNYNQNAQAGAQIAQGQPVHQGYSQPGTAFTGGVSQQVTPNVQGAGIPNQNIPGQGVPGQGMPGQGVPGQGMPGQGIPQQRQVPPQQRQVPPQQRVPNQGASPQPPVAEMPPKPKKKFPKILIVLPVLTVLVGGGIIVGTKFMGKSTQEAVVQDYTTSGRFAYDTLQNALATWDATAIDAIVGQEDGDSWLAQEWSWVNGVKLRQEYLKKVGAMIQFQYPQVPQMATDGTQLLQGGNPVMIESYMNAGESVTFNIPDYAVLAETMKEETDYIQKMYKSYLDSAENLYRLPDDLFNLMMQYLCDKPQLPTKEVSVALTVRLSLDGTPYIESDAELDDLLFGNEDFRNMSETFSQVALGWTGFKDEHYTEKEEQHNDEWDAWHAKFIAYYEADGGHYDPATHTYSGGKFNKNRSQWEPWYLRDENNQYVLDENGEKVVNYFSIKAEDGTDWIQPDETILVDVEKVRQVEDPWVNESGIRHDNLGVHYITESYNGKGTRVCRVGDGTVNTPAGIGTPIVTKALCDDGKYHDVEVAVIGYWVGEDAINYSEKFSQRNRGFTTSSVVQLITYELTIRNLETEPITLNSEMTLCDKNANVSSRTGTMYDFLNENITIKPNETVTVNDWASSTELAQKYVCWGKSFGRQYPTIYFDCLAGTGVIPSYSAYTEFTGNGVVTSK